MSAAIIACHDCDLLYRAQRVPPGGRARCRRCRGVLYREKKNSIERTLALTLAGSILFVVANLLPFLSFDMQGQVTQTTLTSGVVELYAQGRPGLSPRFWSAPKCDGRRARRKPADPADQEAVRSNRVPFHNKLSRYSRKV